MSEHLRFDPTNGILKVPTGTGEVLGTNCNSSIFLHPYESRGSDHVFVMTGEDDEQTFGVYLFRSSSDVLMERFDDLVGELVSSEFEVIHCEQVSPGDEKQYQRIADKVVEKISMADLEKPWELSV